MYIKFINLFFFFLKIPLLLHRILKQERIDEKIREEEEEKIFEKKRNKGKKTEENGGWLKERERERGRYWWWYSYTKNGHRFHMTARQWQWPVINNRIKLYTHCPTHVHTHPSHRASLRYSFSRPPPPPIGVFNMQYPIYPIEYEDRSRGRGGATHISPPTLS